MNNYLHPGNTLTLAAPYEVNGGDCVQVGAIFGVAKSWASCGEQVEIITTGVFEVRKKPGKNGKLARDFIGTLKTGQSRMKAWENALLVLLWVSLIGNRQNLAR